MVYIAHQNNSAATLEAAADDIVPLYRKAPAIFDKVLSEKPFLIEATCRSLGAYFDLYGRDGKSEFLSKIKSKFEFSSSQLLTCEKAYETASHNKRMQSNVAFGHAADAER